MANSLLVAAIVFAANAGLLVLQLLAGRFLAPLVGSSLETWTAIIGFFLLGIALGNAVGGRVADRYPHPRLLALFLAAGSLAALAMIGVPRVLSGMHAPLPLLAFFECFPAGFVLSLITPLAIRLGLPSLDRTGRAAGTVFALGTVGCLVGNYATGFLLIPNFSISTIAVIVAGLFAGLAGLCFVGRVEALRNPTEAATTNATVSDGPGRATKTQPDLQITKAIAIVFLCSFCSMTLELTASRILAELLGVSLYTWTGIIGVMLAGTATGNWLGGRLADRGGGLRVLTHCLLAAAAASLVILLAYFNLARTRQLADLPLVPQILAWTFALFFLPMTLLGTISPQVIKLTVTDVAHAGRTAGRIYAWSTAGAIAGTFATGYLLVSMLGMYRTVLATAAVITLASGLVTLAWSRTGVFVTAAALLGLTLSALVVVGPGFTEITRETNYFTIRVQTPRDQPGTLELRLDLLAHSLVKLDDPTFLFYPHEQIQLALFRDARQPANVLVIGGGGYTFPRAAKTVGRADTVIDVVEIDPGVTAISYSHFGLDPKLGIRSHHMDGRRFLARAPAGHYDLITLDAVNDLSVPWHLLTRECNEAAKRALTRDGVYLVTVIDNPARGQLWKAAMATLRETFQHVETLSFREPWQPEKTMVQLIYASDRPFNVERMKTAGILRAADRTEPGMILTDEFAPVDNLMGTVFRSR